MTEAGGKRALTGGRMSPGVVLVDGLVHRPMKLASTFVAALLRHCEQQGFEGAPRYLGQVEGMDVLSYIPGDVPARFGVWSDEQVAAAGSLLRGLHDATREAFWPAAARSSVITIPDRTTPYFAVAGRSPSLTSIRRLPEAP